MYVDFKNGDSDKIWYLPECSKCFLHICHRHWLVVITFLYFLQCMSLRGRFLEPYMPKLQQILRKALRIQNKEGHGSVVIITRNLLRSFTSVYPKEYWSCPEGYDRPLSEHLPIRQWGKPGNIHSLKVSQKIHCV